MSTTETNRLKTQLTAFAAAHKRLWTWQARNAMIDKCCWNGWHAWLTVCDREATYGVSVADALGLPQAIQDRLAFSHCFACCAATMLKEAYVSKHGDARLRVCLFCPLGASSEAHYRRAANVSEPLEDGEYACLSGLYDRFNAMQVLRQDKKAAQIATEIANLQWSDSVEEYVDHCRNTDMRVTEYDETERK